MVLFATVLISTLAGAVSAVGISRDPDTLMAVRAEAYKRMKDRGSQWYQVEIGQTCDGISKEMGISMENFLRWNTEITKPCQGLRAGHLVCVGFTDTPTGSSSPPPAATSRAGSSVTVGAAKTTAAPSGGAQASCKGQIYAVQSGDSCSKIKAQYTNINLGQFYKDYTAVGTSCGALRASQTYCFPTQSAT